MASKPHPLTPLEAALKDLTAWLRGAKVPGAVIGGVASTLLGRPRLTRDIDVLVWLDESSWQLFLVAGERFDFKPRVADALRFAQLSRMMLVRHQSSSVDVDVSLGALPFEEEAVASALPARVGRVRVPLPTPENLIVMKAVAHRPRDWSDIDGIIEVQPRLDVRHIRRWVREFAAALEMPELVAELEKRLASRARSRTRKRRS